jgi:3-carboxy-cis,cis-muconate cycloisomerase
MTSEVFDGVFGTTAVSAALDDVAIIDAMCEAETALARACARAGLVELPVALEIGAACEEVRSLAAGELSRRAAGGGNPVIPLVAELRAVVERRAGSDAAAAVHLGATSQDILDTALMLVASRALGIVVADVGDCATSTAGLAHAHRNTPMAARTLLQRALPTTFGAVAAGWGSALDAAGDKLRSVRSELPVQLGGAAGTLSVLHPKGWEVQSAFADELDLAVPAAIWHNDRTVITELAGALGTCAATLAKVATDIVLLAQSDVGELREGEPGGSSAMAHKQNPIAAITARGAAMQAPGLVATLLSAAAPELQRGAGSWHAEWPALLALLRYTGGAASRLRSSLNGLQVVPETMSANLAALSDDVDIADTGAAGEIVDRYLERRPR